MMTSVSQTVRSYRIGPLHNLDLAVHRDKITLDLRHGHIAKYAVIVKMAGFSWVSGLEAHTQHQTRTCDFILPEAHRILAWTLTCCILMMCMLVKCSTGYNSVNTNTCSTNQTWANATESRKSDSMLRTTDSRNTSGMHCVDMTISYGITVLTGLQEFGGVDLPYGIVSYEHAQADLHSTSLGIGE